jgi:hypothetical protein
VNLDGKFDSSDVIQFQQWLVSDPYVELKYWENADLNGDGKLDIFDLCLMKTNLISN